jgi:translation initiation factor 1
MNADGRRVYSTAQGRVCPRCQQAVKACTCRETGGPPRGDGIVRLSREVKGRKGKGVTAIAGLPLSPAEVAALARQLKQLCGSGGTVKNGRIEIQGDHRERLAAELQRRGFAVKRSGG